MATAVHCKDVSSKQAIENVMTILLKLINECRWIIDAYVSDFYTHRHWERLSHSVQDYFHGSKPPDLAWMLSNGKPDLKTEQRHKGERIVPLSLLALQCCLQAHSLNRVAVDLDSSSTLEDIKSILRLVGKDRTPLSLPVSGIQTKSMKPPRYKNGQCMDMQHIFRKHVKPKKQHEIQKLGQTISLVSELSQCRDVVDVGAGLGHLSRLLSFQHSLRVTTVEAADEYAPKAATYDREMKQDIQKKHRRAEQSVEMLKEDLGVVPMQAQLTTPETNGKPPETTHSTTGSSLMTQPSTVQTIGKPSETGYSTNRQSGMDVHNFEDHERLKPAKPSTKSVINESLPYHVVCRIQPNIAASQFLDILTKAEREDSNTEKDESEEEKDSPKFVLASLHACGDLTPTLLRVFVNCPMAAGLASVSCCYMKMTARCFDDRLKVDKSDLCNYPLSNFLKTQPRNSLSYAARELACHSADVYRERLIENTEHLKIHSFRAALQHLLVQLKPDFVSGQLRFVSKKGTPASFVQYVKENVPKAGINPDTVPIDLLRYCEELTVNWHWVMAFYTLRLSLAPTVETLMLLDRMLFLMEHGIPSTLVPIFDSSISPRNFALLAAKR